MSEEGSFNEDSFKSQLDAEMLLTMQINRCAIYRDSDIRRYCTSIETLIIICPRHVREKALERLGDLGLVRGKYGSITDDRLVVYDDLLIYINEQLEKQKMIWRKKTVRTYE